MQACQKEFRSYVFGMAEWYGPVGMDKKYMNHTVPNTYGQSPADNGACRKARPASSLLFRRCSLLVGFWITAVPRLGSVATF